VKRKGRTGFALAAAATSLCGVVLGLPILMLAGGAPSEGCAEGQPNAFGDGSPTILGTSALAIPDLEAWWGDTGRGQPPNLAMPVDDVLAIYLDEGRTEGVRGDLAVAQAIHETGWFTSGDVARNNFAGIAHHDGSSAGRRFATPLAGVRAHIQLLKKFAAGNDVALANADAAPVAGARATTWAELAGTWATDPHYWNGVRSIYMSMLGRDGLVPSGAVVCAPAGQSSPAGQVVSVRNIQVDGSIATQVDAMLTAAESDGVMLTGTGYRSQERQIELRRAHCGSSHYDVFEKPASACSPPTARPGTSQHEVGLAMDFDYCSTTSTRCWRWLDQHAETYGFYNLVGGAEPWHWSTTGR
jgi:hypothetical protein